MANVIALPHAETDRLLRTAIADRRLISFVLDDLERTAEPHDYGVINGERRLFFYQVGGQSRSGRPPGWRWAVLAKMSKVQVLDQHFAGPRPAPTGRHVDWDELFASVSRARPSKGKL